MGWPPLGPRVNEGIPPRPLAGVGSESFPLHLGSLTGEGSQEQAVTTGEGTRGRAPVIAGPHGSGSGQSGSGQLPEVHAPPGPPRKEQVQFREPCDFRTGECPGPGAQHRPTSEVQGETDHLSGLPPPGRAGPNGRDV